MNVWALNSLKIYIPVLGIPLSILQTSTIRSRDYIFLIYWVATLWFRSDPGWHLYSFLSLMSQETINWKWLSYNFKLILLFKAYTWKIRFSKLMGKAAYHRKTRWKLDLCLSSFINVDPSEKLFSSSVKINLYPDLYDIFIACGSELYSRQKINSRFIHFSMMREPICLLFSGGKCLLRLKCAVWSDPCPIWWNECKFKVQRNLT